jgi:hypothetical protein
MAYVVLTVRLTLAGVFLVAGIAKARNRADTVQLCRGLLRSIGIRSAGAAERAAWALVLTELSVGGALLASSALTVPALAAACGLLLVFACLAVVSAVGVLDLRCACFGRAVSPLGWRHVGRNTVLLVMGGAGLWLGPSPETGSLHAGGVVLSVGISLVVTALVVSFDDIADLVQSSSSSPSYRSY